MAHPTVLAPLTIASSKCSHIVVPCGDRLGPAGCNALMRAGMDQRIMDNEIAALRQRRKERGIGGIAAGEIERPLRSEKGGSFRFQRLVLGMIAAQQTRPAGADGNAALQRCGNGRLDAWRVGKAKIVVRGEIDATLRYERTPPSLPLQPASVFS